MLLVLVAAAASPAAGASGRDALEPCRVSNIARPALCGTYEVPEDRFTREGRKIALNVVVFPATSKTPLGDPLFVLEGGPGASVVTAAAAYVPFFAPLLDRRDLVLVDQRGTGQSNPLRCELKSTSYELAEVEACRDTVLALADPIHYITPHAVDDIDEVRAWLGYERINLFGGSYGSRSVLTYLRRHGEKVRTAITMATYPHDRNAILEAAPIAQRAVDGVIELCADDDRCAAAFPDLREDLAKVIERFRETGPIGEGESTITQGEFGAALRLMLFFPSLSAQLPNVIHRAAEGDFGPYRIVLGKMRGQMGGWISIGTLLTILCGEDGVRIESSEQIAKVADNTDIGPAWSQALFRACGLWPEIPLPEDYHEPVRSDVPVLLLHGRHDPSMPPGWSRHAARTLPNSLVVEVPEGVHSFIGMTNPFCLQGIVTRFVTGGTVEGIETGCVDTMKHPAFDLGD